MLSRPVYGVPLGLKSSKDMIGRIFGHIIDNVAPFRSTFRACFNINVCQTSISTSTDVSRHLCSLISF